MLSYILLILAKIGLKISPYYEMMLKMLLSSKNLELAVFLGACK